jgi:hypothetical protein
MAKRNKIEWENIRITVIPVNKENPNRLNPCARLSSKEREQEIIFICAKIWSRVMKDKMLQTTGFGK